LHGLIYVKLISCSKVEEVVGADEKSLKEKIEKYK
jgi:hypothetical protein